MSELHEKLSELAGGIKEALKAIKDPNSHEKSAIIYAEVLGRMIGQAAEMRAETSKLVDLGANPPAEASPQKGA